MAGEKKRIMLEASTENGAVATVSKSIKDQVLKIGKLFSYFSISGCLSSFARIALMVHCTVHYTLFRKRERKLRDSVGGYIKRRTKILVSFFYSFLFISVLSLYNNDGEIGRGENVGSRKRMRIHYLVLSSCDMPC